MDRQIIYVDQNPLDTDQLLQSKNAMIALGMAIQAVIGISTLFDGLACNPTGPASLQVLVGPGSVYSLQNVDSTAYGSVAADTTHQIVKQGISLGTLTLNCAAPGTTGQSINYLIQAAYEDVDTGATVLPYFDSTNPDQAFNGPNNTGVSQNTVRQGQCVVNVKAGVAATTGSQTTPAPTAGFTGLWVVTVANGQTTITSGNISLAPSAPFISEKLGDKISIPTGDARYLMIGTGLRTRLTANATYHVATTGSDSNAGTSGSPWLTLQHAWNYIQQNVDLAGFTATIQISDGTYTGGLAASGPVSGSTGAGGIIFNGNSVTPDNVLISTTGSCYHAEQGATYTVQNQKLTCSGGNSSCVEALNGGNINVGTGVDFGNAGLSHIDADTNSVAVVSGNYNITGGATAHLRSFNQSTIKYLSSVTVTLTGTPAFSGAFAQCYNTTLLYIPSITFSGSATGLRFDIQSNSILQTLGTTATTYLPGSSNGTQVTGGQYL